MADIVRDTEEINAIEAKEKIRKAQEHALALLAGKNTAKQQRAEAMGQGFSQAIEGDKRYPDLFTRARDSEVGKAVSGHIAGSLAGVGARGMADAAVDAGLLAKPPTPPLPADPEGVKQDPERDATNDEVGGPGLPATGTGGGRAAVMTSSPYTRQSELGHNMSESRDHMAKAAAWQLEAINLERRAVEAHAENTSAALEMRSRERQAFEAQVARDEAKRREREEAFRQKVEAVRAEGPTTGEAVGEAIAAIGVALGAYSAALSKTPNTALQIFNSVVDRNLERQKMRVAGAESDFERIRRITGDERQAEIALRMRFEERARDHLAKVEAAAKTDFARAKAAELKAHLENSLADNIAKMRVIEDGRVVESHQPTYVVGRDGMLREIPAERPHGWDGAAKQNPEGAPVEAAMPGTKSDKEVAAAAPQGEPIKVGTVEVGSASSDEADERAAAARARSQGTDTRGKVGWKDGEYDAGSVDAYLQKETQPLREEAARRAAAAAPAPGQRPIKSFTRDATPAISPTASPKELSDQVSALRERAKTSGEKVVYAKILDSIAKGKWTKDGRSLLYDQGRDGKLQEVLDKADSVAGRMYAARDLAQAAEALKRAAPKVSAKTLAEWEARNAEYIANNKYSDPFHQAAAGVAATLRDRAVSDLSAEAKKMVETVMRMRANFISEKGGKALSEGEKANLNIYFGALENLSGGIDGIASASAAMYEKDRDMWNVRMGTQPLLNLLTLYQKLGPDKVNPPPYRGLARATVAPR